MKKLTPPHYFKVRNLKAQPTYKFEQPTEDSLPSTEFIDYNKPKPSPQKASTTTAASKAPERWAQLYEPKATFYIAKLSPLCTIDKSTLRWIRNGSDERAAQEGMRFSEKRGQFVVDWVEDHCRLYEDSVFVKAGSPLLCDDWQYEYFMQLFGWQQHSEELGQWIRRFIQAGIWIAKKNAKSPTLAATGLYMLIGDGEQGQKCYSVARDGKQAKIAHNHAIEMVKMSPVLMSECKINHTEGVIRHVSTKSIYSVVHGDNSRSTEGFNGSLFCDETHVLEQAHMDRLARAGISRKEPLHVEVSTAGNNADGYGFNRYHYGKKLAACESDVDYNPHFLFIDFSIDQKVTLEELRQEKFVSDIAPACNPALGRILRKSEFMQDWRDSTQSDSELRKFAMYRLNLWLKDSVSWIPLADWTACGTSPLREQLGRQYTLQDLQEYPCVAGVDLSKTLDMSALSLIFAVPDDQLGVRPYTWSWHWLPKPTADRYRRHVDLYKPEFKDWIQIINQKTVDYETIARRIEWVRDNFDLRCLGYDAYNSGDLVRHLLNDYGWTESMLIKVPQQMRFMGPITKEFERWVIRHEVHHPDNSLISWQFQHVELDTDRLGNYRPIKPDKDDYRKIDGIISMLIAGCVLCSDESVWDRTETSILLFDRKAPDKYGQTDQLDSKGNSLEAEELSND